MLTHNEKFGYEKLTSDQLVELTRPLFLVYESGLDSIAQAMNMDAPERGEFGACTLLNMLCVWIISEAKEALESLPPDHELRRSPVLREAWIQNIINNAEANLSRTLNTQRNAILPKPGSVEHTPHDKNCHCDVCFETRSVGEFV